MRNIFKTAVFFALLLSFSHIEARPTVTASLISVEALDDGSSVLKKTTHDTHSDDDSHQGDPCLVSCQHSHCSHWLTQNVKFSSVLTAEDAAFAFVNEFIDSPDLDGIFRPPTA